MEQYSCAPQPAVQDSLSEVGDLSKETCSSERPSGHSAKWLRPICSLVFVGWGPWSGGGSLATMWDRPPVVYGSAKARRGEGLAQITGWEDGRWEARALLTPAPQSAAPGPHPHRKPLRICSFSLKDLLLVHFQLSANRGAGVGGSAASCYTEGSELCWATD